jgi:hypothetical protein
LAVSGRFCRAFWGGEEKAGKDFHRPKIVHWPQKEDKISPVSAFGNETFLKRFPQASTGLSKANLAKWFFYVNLHQQYSAFALFIPI